MRQTTNAFCKSPTEKLPNYPTRPKARLGLCEAAGYTRQVTARVWLCRAREPKTTTPAKGKRVPFTASTGLSAKENGTARGSTRTAPPAQKETRPVTEAPPTFRSTKRAKAEV